MEVKKLSQDARQCVLSLRERLRVLPDEIRRLSTDREQFLSLLEQILNSGDRTVNTISVQQECAHCKELSEQLENLESEKAMLDCMKLCSEKSAAENERFREVIEKLQQEGRIDRENKMVAEKKMKELAGHYHEISLEVESSKQQIKKCMTWIRELSETVSNLRTRNIELQVIGRHQQCIIDADKETISMLKAELESLPI